MQTKISRCLGLMFSVMGISFVSLSAKPAWAGETVAYCDTPRYAVNIFQNEASQNTEQSLFIRVFWREKSLIFAELPVQRGKFVDAGYTYTSQSEVSDDYGKSLWTLFIPSSDGQPCLLFRNGKAFDDGEVTQKES